MTEDTEAFLTGSIIISIIGFVIVFITMTIYIVEMILCTQTKNKTACYDSIGPAGSILYNARALGGLLSLSGGIISMALSFA